MVVQVQVLSVQSRETAPSLLLATDTRRFLFNVGDGTQRLCMEHHVRLAKLQHVFLTELRTYTVGGLPGMVLTISDSGKSGLHVHGPPGLQAYVNATRHFLHRPQFKWTASEVEQPVPVSSTSDPTPRRSSCCCCYQDNDLAVYAVAVANVQSGAKRKRSETLLPAESDTTDRYVGVSYVIETKPQRGKFLVERALALGVPKGKLFGQLHHGHDVTLPDGRVVLSKDCVEPSVPAAACVILSCPTIAHVEALVSSPLFHRYRAPTASQETAAVQVDVVFHTAGPSVLSHPKYAAWVQSFGPQARHVLLGHTACAQKTVHRASAKLQAQLHAVLPRVFPSNEAHEQRDAAACFARTVPDLSSWRSRSPLVDDLEPAAAAAAAAAASVVLGESMLTFVLVPRARRGFDAARCWPRLEFDQIRESVRPAVAFVASASVPPAPRKLLDTADLIDGRITFLGTGCAIPSKYRNVTGMYLELPTGEHSDNGEPVWAGLMLDCGEGSVGQMYRSVGGDDTRLQALLDRLKCVWISHNHADHHLGLLHLLSRRATSGTSAEPLVVIGPSVLRFWLDEYAAVDPTTRGTFSFVESFSFDETDPRSLEVDVHAEAARVRTWLRATLAIAQLECVPVTHALQSYAAVLTFTDGSKMAFSGDCRPSDALARKATGAFLIVHEATFEDDLSKEAKEKAHCTIAEAVHVGRQAKARHLVLTHFSQRYPKTTALLHTCDEGAGDGRDGDEAPMQVLTAVDLLSLRFRELHQPYLVQVCTQLLTLDDAAPVDVESTAKFTTPQAQAAQGERHTP